MTNRRLLSSFVTALIVATAASQNNGLQASSTDDLRRNEKPVETIAPQGRLLQAKPKKSGLLLACVCAFGYTVCRKNETRDWENPDSQIHLDAKFGERTLRCVSHSDADLLTLTRF